MFGSDVKDTIIFELELAAGVFALLFRSELISDGLQILFCDNDGMRHSLIKGSTEGYVPNILMQIHLKHEAECNLATWFARVPTESNLSDYPSRNAEHALLLQDKCFSTSAFEAWKTFLGKVECGAALEIGGGRSE